MAAPDLITQSYLTAAIGDILSSAELAKLPSLTTSASRAVRVWCNRYFTRRSAIDELYTVQPRGSIVLREYPVNGVSRLSANPSPVVTIANNDPSTNQRATVALATTGSVDLGLAVTGVTLTRWASGVQLAASVPFNLSLTIQAVATAINAVGGGWTASVGTGFGPWPSADLRGVQAAQPALNNNQASLDIHADDLAFTLDEVAGIVYPQADPSGLSGATQFGPAFEAGWGDTRLSGVPMGVRVVYDAGFDAIPEDVQQAVVEVVQAQLSRLETDPSLNSETIRDYTWRSGDRLPAIPDSAKEKLIPWRNTRG